MSPAGEDITALADEVFASSLAADPFRATSIGVRGHDHEVPDLTEEAEAQRDADLADFERRAAGIDPGGLSEQDRITRDVVLWEVRTERSLLAARLEELNVSALLGAQAQIITWTVPRVRLAEPEHAEQYLERLSKLDRYLDQAAERLRRGVARGRTPVARNVDNAIGQIDRYLDGTGQDPLTAPEPPADWASVAAWRSERGRVITEVVRPALARFRDVLRDEVRPTARPDDRPGVSALPDGRELYATVVAAHTTTDLGPQEIHELGREMMAELREEYGRIGAVALGTEDVEEVLERIRTDPSLRFTSEEELVGLARETVRRATEAAPAWFGRLPRAVCEVEVIPAHEAPTAPPAYYQPPAVDGSRPGTYWQNAHAPQERTRVEIQAVAFHEAVPGHHLQYALAQELDLPALRRFAPVTAYLEGWGLYAERLADEMGLYATEIDRLGMVVTDSMRACRLVIDTGIHEFGWTRDDAVAYFRANSPMPANDIETEVDRYIAWPGQALGYMIGRREIERLRAEAQRALGDRFDLPAWHDVVLGVGPVPLGVLEGVVRRWIEGS